MRLFQLVILASLWCFLFPLAVASNHKQLNFIQTFKDNIATYDSPSRIFKSQQGQMWLLFDRHLSIVADGFSRQIPYKSISGKTNTGIRPHIVQNEHGIYFSVGDEVFHYGPDNGVFTRLDLQLKPQDLIVAIIKDREGSIWIATYLSLSKVFDGQSVESFGFPKQFIDVEVGSPLLYSAVFSPSNELYLGTYSFGLLKFNEQSGFSLVDERFKKQNTIEVMDFVRNELLLGTASGLFSLQPETKDLQQLFASEVKQPIVKLNINNDDGFYFAAKKRLWQSDAGKSRLVEIILPEIEKLGGTSALKAIHIDDEDVVWLSVKDQGLFSYHPLRHKLSPADLKITEQRNTQSALILDPSHYLLSNKQSTYLSNMGKSIQHPVYAHLKLGKNVYLGSNGYLLHMDEQGNLHQIDHAKGSMYPDEKIVVLSSDADKRIWMVAEKSGLYVFQAQAGQITPSSRLIDIPLQVKVLVRYVKPFGDNAMILATMNSLYRYDTDTATLTLLESIEHPVVQFQSLGNNEILLISDDDVVFTYQIEKQQLHRHDFAINNIGCVLKHQGRWLIAQKNGRLYQYEKGNLSYFDVEDGIPVGGLNGKACFSLNDTAYFAGFNGLYSLNHNNNARNAIKPTTSIHSIVVKQQVYLATTFAMPELAIKDSDFPIRFNISSSSFVNMAKNRYQYRFKNKDLQWRNFTQDNRQIDFSALSADVYHIEFRTANNHGVWSEPVAFKLEVEPPVWLNPWAKLLYFVLALVLGYWFYAHRLKSAQLRAEKLQLLVAQRTQEVNVEKQHIEALLSQRQQELVQVSHELRTPIALISGPVSQVLEASQSQKDKATLQIAYRNCQRLAGIVDQLIDLDRFRLQKSQQMTNHNAAKILEFIVASFVQSAQNKDISLVLSQNPHCHLLCVPDALEKMLMNLISNAIKYTANDGKIDIKAQHLPGGHYQIAVKDTGKGIEAEHLPHLFNTFYRVNDEQTQSQPGAGVGLALVKELIEFHGGTIEVSSEPGAGSEFRLQFPASVVNQEAAKDNRHNMLSLQSQIRDLSIHQDGEPVELQGGSAGRHKTTVLIIEDNLDMQQFLSSVLGEHYFCLVESNGSDGVDAALEHMPDLIITDVMMPKMDGFEVSQTLKEDVRTSHIPIIILTARGDRDSRMQGWKALADEYLAKPFDSEELLMRVENLLTIRTLMSHRLARDISQSTAILSEQESALSTKDQEFIERFDDILLQKYTDPEFSIDDIADSVFMSKRQLQRKIKALFDYTPSEYLRVYRLKKAHGLIAGGAKITEVSQDTGFSSHSYFGRCFKAHFGCTPSEVQSQHEPA